MVSKFSMTELEDSTDRGCAIIGATNVEVWLEKALRRHLVNSRRHASWFFRDGAPLSSFEAKIRIAHLTGLVSEEMMQELLILKDLREMFISELATSSFDSPVVSHMIQKFSYIPSLDRARRHSARPKSNRITYEIVVYTVCDYLGSDFAFGMPHPIA